VSAWAARPGALSFGWSRRCRYPTRNGCGLHSNAAPPAALVDCAAVAADAAAACPLPAAPCPAVGAPAASHFAAATAAAAAAAYHLRWVARCATRALIAVH